MNAEQLPAVQVGKEFRVLWSNGAGYSVYRVLDDPGIGSHLFSLVGQFYHDDEPV